MRKEFIHYNKKNKKETEELWKKALITVDTNVLLNLYRYSKDTRLNIIGLFNKLSDKLFITHQVGLEFHQNRFDVIQDQVDVYSKFIKDILNINNDLTSNSKQPFLDNKLQIKFNEIIEEVKNDVTKSCEFYNNLNVDDSIYNELDIIFSNNITEKYDDTKLETIFKEGQKRYADKIPPGYEDEKNKKDNRKYGDLIIWYQLIDFAIKNKKPIILVTDENKSDWWWKNKKENIIGPRFELIKEMQEKANVEFHMYSIRKFTEYATNFLHQKQNTNALKEISYLSEREMIEKLRFERLKREFDKRADELYKNTERYIIGNRISDNYLLNNKWKINQSILLKNLYEEQLNLKLQLEHLLKNNIDSNNDEEIYKIKILLSKIEEEINKLEK